MHSVDINLVVDPYYLREQIGQSVCVRPCTGTRKIANIGANIQSASSQPSRRLLIVLIASNICRLFCCCCCSKSINYSRYTFTLEPVTSCLDRISLPICTEIRQMLIGERRLQNNTFTAWISSDYIRNLDWHLGDSRTTQRTTSTGNLVLIAFHSDATGETGDHQMHAILALLMRSYVKTVRCSLRKCARYYRDDRSSVRLCPSVRRNRVAVNWTHPNVSAE